MGYGSAVMGYRLWVMGYGFMGCGGVIIGYGFMGLWVMSYRVRGMEYRLWGMVGLVDRVGM